MITGAQTVFRCDNDNKILTNRKHIRIVLGYESGVMIPPYYLPIGIVDKPVKHFCSAMCLTEYLTKKVDEANEQERVRRSKRKGAVCLREEINITRS